MKAGNEIDPRGDYAHVVNPVHKIYGEHGGHETVKVRDVRRIFEGRGLRGGAGKRVNGMAPGRPQSFRYQRLSIWTTATLDEEEWHKTTEQGAERFMTKARAGLRHLVVCSNITGRTKDTIAQSKRARAGSVALVD